MQVVFNCGALIFQRGITCIGVLILALALVACDSTSGGKGDGSTVGDEARREVLKDIAEQIILPSLQDFHTKAVALKTAVDALVAAPEGTDELEAAQNAWRAAMAAWQRNEPLQVGPAGRFSDMVKGGEDFRDYIYSWPLPLKACDLEAAAKNGSTVNEHTLIDMSGLGAVEYLLFTSFPSACASGLTATQRAVHLQKLAARIASMASNLRNSWEPANGNFIEQWSSAGLASEKYMKPQDALNALSVALFYVEKSGKDRKIAYTTGVGTTDFYCTEPASCPELLESRLSRNSGANLIANVQVLRDVFTGLNGKRGLNDLLEGIDRKDLADEIVSELDAVLAKLEEIETSTGFDTAVENISNRNTCLNAFANSTGLAPCALLGLTKTAMDTLRGPIYSALSLAIPSSAAGDND